MTALREMIDALEPQATGGWSGVVPDGWLQGRTCYGGLSTAMALHCAMASAPDLPPLRSAQVSFVGPLAGTVSIATTLLRRGRNAAFVQADIVGEAGLGLRCTFVFMRAIDSELRHDRADAPDRRVPTAAEETLKGHPLVPFTANFEFAEREVRGEAEWLRWARLNERDGIDPMVELMAIGDALPPAALRLLGRNVPMSSLTWIVNLLTPQPATDGGWWLLRSAADHAVAGGSSQVMGIWNARGEKVAEQMQSVAIFG